MCSHSVPLEWGAGWGEKKPLRGILECLDLLLDDSRGCLTDPDSRRYPFALLPLGTPGTVLCAHSRCSVQCLWVWLGVFLGSWKGTKLEFSDTLALREA